MVGSSSMGSIWSCGSNRHESVGMTSPETSWIEQEAIEKWWNKHRFELKQAVTVERVRLQEENEELKGEYMQLESKVFELEKELVFVRAVIDKCTPNDYARTQAENEKLKKRVKELETLVELG